MDLSVRDVGEVSEGGGRESRGRISPFFSPLTKNSCKNQMKSVAAFVVV